MNKITKSVFDNSQKEIILKTISDEFLNRKVRQIDEYGNTKEEYNNDNDIKIHPSMGRLIIEDLNFGSLINNYVTSLINVDKQIQYLSATYCEYSGKYGTPNLNMHKDHGRKETICLDYQLESNTLWDMIIDDQTYMLADNEAVSFYSMSQTHGRPDRVFLDSDYMKMIFFYFEVQD